MLRSRHDNWRHGFGLLVLDGCALMSLPYSSYERLPIVRKAPI